MNEKEKCEIVKGVKPGVPEVPEVPATTENLLRQLVEIQEKISVFLEFFSRRIIRKKYYDEVRVSETTEYVPEYIFDFLNENAEKVMIVNDGLGLIYVIYTNDGSHYSKEFVLYEGEAKTYLNVHTIQIRTPRIGVRYRVTEFEVSRQSDVTYFEGNPYIYETVVALVGQKNIHDIREGNSTINGVAITETQALLRSAHSGYVENLGPGNLLVEFSSDGTSYSGVRTLSPGQSQPLDKMDIVTLRLDTNVNNTAYRIGAQ